MDIGGALKHYVFVGNIKVKFYFNVGYITIKFTIETLHSFYH